MKKSGFTLMELIVVIGMLSVIALLFVVSTGNIGDVSVDSASWKIQSDLRYAHQLAVSKRINHGIVFTQGGNYTVYAGTVANPVRNPETQAPMIENLQRFSSVQVNNNFHVEFNPIGKPVIGGGGYVEIISDSGSWRRIFVETNTGAVIVDVLNYGATCGCKVCE